MNITGNTILMTGGGTGIGRALAEALHARGNKIIITGRRRNVLEETVTANPGMSFMTLDIADGDAIRDFADEVLRDHPDLNVLVNNAGIMPSEDLTAEALDINTIESVISTNLLGPIRLTVAMLSHLREKADAVVVNVSSGLAFVPIASTPTYCATKAALHSWSESLRYQLSRTSVSVLELVPPAVATDLAGSDSDNDGSMPLDDFILEVVSLLERNETHRGEILVEQVKDMRFAELGDYQKVFKTLNTAYLKV